MGCVQPAGGSGAGQGNHGVCCYQKEQKQGRLPQAAAAGTGPGWLSRKQHVAILHRVSYLTCSNCVQMFLWLFGFEFL